MNSSQKSPFFPISPCPSLNPIRCDRLALAGVKRTCCGFHTTPLNLVSFMKSQQNLSHGRDDKPGLNNTAGRLLFSLLALSPLCRDECLIHSKISSLLHNKATATVLFLYELGVGPHSLLWRGHISETSRQCLNEPSMISP